MGSSHIYVLARRAAPGFFGGFQQKTPGVPLIRARGDSWECQEAQGSASDRFRTVQSRSVEAGLRTTLRAEDISKNMWTSVLVFGTVVGILKLISQAIMKVLDEAILKLQ